MSPEAQRIAIAEACGWRDIKHTDHEDVDIESRSIIYWSGLTGVPPEFIHYENRISIPDYLNSLNAMHEAENVIIRADLLFEYGMHISTDHDYEHLLRATASQRAEAFLRTIDKWEGAK